MLVRFEFESKIHLIAVLMTLLKFKFSQNLESCLS